METPGAGLGTALIILWPHRVQPGTVRRELLMNIDLAPTLLEAAGCEPPPWIGGRSFLPLLTGEGRYRPREEVFAEKNFHDHYDPMRAVRTARYKYIRSFEPRPILLLPSDIAASEPGRHLPPEAFLPRPTEELYDLKNDPDELANPAEAPGLPK